MICLRFPAEILKFLLANQHIYKTFVKSLSKVWDPTSALSVWSEVIMLEALFLNLLRNSSELYLNVLRNLLQNL